MRWVYLVLAACAFGLSGFLLYLTLARDDVPARGFVLAGGILAVGLFCVVRARSVAAVTPEPPPR